MKLHENSHVAKFTRINGQTDRQTDGRMSGKETRQKQKVAIV